LVAAQAILNLIMDWNRDIAEMRTPEVDEDEVEALKKSLGGGTN